MKLIELHILQSFPVSCLNRDDVGAPKTAIFGGEIRARISSQCLKRAIRELAKAMLPDRFAGERSCLIITPLVEALKRQGVAEPDAVEIAKQVCDGLAKVKVDKTAAIGDELKLKTLMFLSPAEIKRIADAIATSVMQDPKAKDFKKEVAKACKSALLLDAADIAIFGRMVASDHSLTLEGAGMFSHALSTHQASNEIDFYSAVDELQKAEESGAAMLGTLEFTSATFYRYAALNLNLLADADHLGALTPDERKGIVETFLRASILAVPGARKNSMNANTLPGYVLGIVKNEGQPLQLVNAFERPVKKERGFLDISIKELKNHHEQLKKTWDIKIVAEQEIPNVDINTFCRELAAYVI